MTDEPILSVRDLKKHYPLRKGIFNRQVGAAKAVDGISFDIASGETLGLVGESGCGKSTAASSVIRLEEPTAGEVVFNGNGRGGATRNPDGTHPNDVTKFSDAELKRFRRGAQMIFQDPASSFDPRMTVGSAVAEMLEIHGMSDRHRRRAIVEDLLERVGLSAVDYDRYPHEFSGGQKQRIALARALVLNPDLIIADEPVSALDVSIQAEILSLIDDLQAEFDLSMLFISHDMSVIRRICDRVAVMYLGEIVEVGPTDEIFADPQHPYTEALLSSIPTPDPRSSVGGIELTGTVPSPTNPPSGCRFHTRCHRVIQPEGIDIDQSDWRGILNFRDRVAAGQVDVESIRENIVVEGGAASDNDVREQLRKEFDIGERLDDPEIEDTLREVIDRLLARDDEEAAELLSDRFSTPCAETTPERTVHAEGHESACLRHESEHVVAASPIDG
ncbi:ABC transporter ATP-binding protein [Halorubrum lacusprofundi]|jgi:peptide/nickel transport system ATP-binding protein|uniref:Oligopeptide/dipeptide ABC transporter, ATPase subunit n=1 Tax=Halorubrum lacusprofundi (strain ATCC 49239 / DSM 5036 / JCM 8891 / ACAM 34) TaxID=416348 RepID=B9LUC3_HALLT|nr:oligopeptide/dipeptide ABC transporter ATP-binding protein [Halorubrum lacusprofundi]ACM56280.1 oligopeptide/dipeptide ABC transporter, ATPase subunit [Halorubrum lacusprofundi ATCC 49239]MCG1005412.1 ATP-binding cassette domain-containing protein [Halorubrum lacusprofundi]